MYLSSSFSGIVFHQQGPARWAIDDLVQVPAINLMELNLVAAMHNKERTFSCRKILERQPLVIWPTEGEDFSSRWPGSFESSRQRARN